jgi:hypothetical protein
MRGKCMWNILLDVMEVVGDWENVRLGEVDYTPSTASKVYISI